MTLTDAQEKIIQQAAQAVWDEIGYDCLQAVIEDGQDDVMSRDEVIEVVLDANRLSQMLKHRKADPALVALVNDYSPDATALLRKVLEKTFKHRYYGL